MRGFVGQIEVHILVDDENTTKCANQCPFMVPYPILGDPAAGMVPGHEGIGMQCRLFNYFLGEIKRGDILPSRLKQCLQSFLA